MFKQETLTHAGFKGTHTTYTHSLSEVMTPACKKHRAADRHLSLVTWSTTLER